MSAGHVQLAPDGSGKDVDADAVVSTESGTPTVYRQNVIISDPTTYANKAAVTAAGAQKVDGSAVTQPVSGTFWQATQPVSGTFWQTTQPVSGTVTNGAGSAVIGAVNQNWGTAGRTTIGLTVVSVASVTSEALLTMTIAKGAGVATTTGTSYTVTTGKTFRVEQIRFGVRFATMSTTVTFANETFAFRTASSSFSVTSPAMVQDSMASASNTMTPDSEYTFPSGLELPSGTICGVSAKASATTLLGDVQIIGFEY